nr:MAG TPA: minor capsid protein [Caudoviricetes sp.]
MPKINKAPNAAELEALRKAFLKAETDIINEIARLRSLGNVDYHAVAALNRVQKILKSLEDECWKYVPKMVEKQFYVRVPEARRILEPVEKHLRGYAAAEALTATQYDVVQQLVNNLMGEVIEAELHVIQSLRESVIGPPRNDAFRRVGLQAVANMEARGTGFRKAVPELVRELQQNGVEAFVDKAGRKWSLHTYGNMVCRTTSRQAEIMAVLTADPDHDLYQISSHATTCPVCAPFEGRVYSRSGKDPDFPPLASAFGKIDPDGPNELTNTWLNIHPNCLHILLPWTKNGKTPEEIERIKRFSDPKTNPFTVDPRSQKQIEAYRRNQKARSRMLNDYRQWERYRLALGDKCPKTFATFRRIKYNEPERWEEMLALYREENNFLQQRLDYIWNGEKRFIPTNALIEHARTIAGKGSKTELRIANRLAEKYGGAPGDWKKRVGKISSAKYDFDVHWYELNGKQYDAKVKFRKEK